MHLVGLRQDWGVHLVSHPPLPLQDCAYFEGALCEESERYPGLWQVPLLELEQGGGQLVAVMDPGQQAEGGLGYGANVTGGLSADELDELLRTNFDFRCGMKWVGRLGEGCSSGTVGSRGRARCMRCLTRPPPHLPHQLLPHPAPPALQLRRQPRSLWAVHPVSTSLLLLFGAEPVGAEPP